MNEAYVKWVWMVKGGEEKLVHPGNVENHERAGWTVKYPPTPAAVDVIDEPSVAAEPAAPSVAVETEPPADPKAAEKKAKADAKAAAKKAKADAKAKVEPK